MHLDVIPDTSNTARAEALRDHTPMVQLILTSISVALLQGMDLMPSHQHGIQGQTCDNIYCHSNGQSASRGTDVNDPSPIPHNWADGKQQPFCQKIYRLMLRPANERDFLPRRFRHEHVF